MLHDAQPLLFGIRKSQYMQARTYTHTHMPVASGTMLHVNRRVRSVAIIAHVAPGMLAGDPGQSGGAGGQPAGHVV